MKNTLTTTSKFLLLTLIAVAVGFSLTYAGSLTPSAAPSKTMATLGDVYTLVDTGTSTVSTDFDTPGSVSGTMHSIGDIYDLMSSKIASISAGDIRNGASIFGVAGSYTGPTLQWQTGDSGEYLCWDSTQGCSVGSGETAEGYGAVEYCSNLADDGGGWRLPTYSELVDASPSGNNPDSGFQSDIYWSATEYPGNSNNAWHVYMVDGFGNSDGKGNPYFYARCVR